MPLTRRAEFIWRLRTRTVALGRRTIVVGILNVTPDSFSDGGHFYSPDDASGRATAHALQMLEEGAQIVDIGGESTRPNASALTPGEEQDRILPVIASILQQRREAILSVDTFHASTAELAVAAGAEIVNDVSGHLWDASMSATCAAMGCGTILMHTRGRPREWKSLPPLGPGEVLPLVLNGLAERLDSALAAGVARDRIVLDPGLGFGKRLDENYPLLAHLDQLQQFNLPILAGASRKGFLGHTLAQSLQYVEMPAGRIHATTAANVAAILAGVHMVRTHDVRPAVEAAAIADAILAAR